MGDGVRARGTLLVLTKLTISMLGIGYAWAAQFARVPSLLEEMGLSDEGMSLAFLAGPICGLLVQPIVGTLSDQTTTRCGRRRPWIGASLFLVVSSFLIIGDSYAIGGALGDDKVSRGRGIAVAVAAFWALDFSQNAVQLPCRTLVSDVLVPADVAKGNAMFSFFDGLGKLICYALASTTLDKPKFVKDEPDFATDARLQFGIAALVAMVCVGITLATVTEPPAPSKPSTRSLRDSIVHAWSLAYQVAFLKETTQDKAYELVPTKYVHEDEVDDVLDDEDDESPVGKGETRKSPPPSYSMLRCVCMTEIGLWYGLSSWQVWGGILVGKSILGGTPAGTDLEVEKFQAGILLFSLGLAGANLVSLVVAPAYPWLLRTFGARKLFIAGGCVMSIATGILALLPALSAHHKTFLNDADTGSSFDLVFRDPTFLAAVLLFTLLGFPWSCHMNIPFSTVGRAYQDAPDVGLITATLNTSLCVAQLAMSLTTALLIRLSRGDPSICFAAASVAGIFSVYHACTLQVPYDESDSSSSRLPVVACGAH